MFFIYRHTYEKAVNERDQELEGAQQRLQAVVSARSENDARVTHLTQDLHQTKTKSANQLKEERAKVAQLIEKVNNAIKFSFNI